MHKLSSEIVTVCLDQRFPRILRYETPDGSQSLVGERQSSPPRLHLWEQATRRTFTSDDADVDVSYSLAGDARRATYRGTVACEGQPAADFELVFEFSGADLTVRLQNVREHGRYRFLSIRLAHLVSATSHDAQAMLVTCGWQGRLLDPRKCKPQLIDYNWVHFIARQCGAAYRPGLMMTIDLPGYEDLLIQEVWQYTRVGDDETLASLGAELMYRQRDTGGYREYRFLPPPEKMPKVELLDEPLLCTATREIRLHAIADDKANLDWTDAARYFQSLVPASIRASLATIRRSSTKS